MCHRTPVYVASAPALALLGSPAVMAASTYPTYTVSVAGTWNGSLDSINPAPNGGFAEGNASTILVPWGVPFTPFGALTISAQGVNPAQLDGSWQIVPQAKSTAAGYGNNFCGAIPTNFTLGAHGTWSIPLSQLWGTMGSHWDEPAGSHTYNCQIHVTPPMRLNSAGGVATRQYSTVIYGLPVEVGNAPQPVSSSPTPSATPQPVATVTPKTTSTSTQTPPSSAPTVHPSPSAPVISTRPSVVKSTPTTTNPTPATTPKASRAVKSRQQGVTPRSTQHHAQAFPWWILLLLVAAGIVVVILVRRRNANR